MSGQEGVSGRVREVAVIGAGAAGLCVAKHLIEAGLDVTVYEIGTHVGGLWCYENDSGRSSAYRTLHINTAKNLTCFSDFPFKPEVQRFPDHRDMHAYLEDYADHFGVTPRIRFSSEVTAVRPAFTPGEEPPRWEVETVGGDVRAYDAVCVSTGHLTKPMHVPMFRDEFAGEYLHSHDYREPEPFARKRICVVGTGNSAVDVSSDVCVSATDCVLVARTGVRIGPKLVFGVAFTDITEAFMKPWMPEWIRDRLLRLLIWCVHGDMEKLGLPPASKKVHPTTSATVVGDIVYNRIRVKQGIDRIEGRTIHFTDGTHDDFDVLVGATGYLIELPFLSDEVVPVRDNGVRLYQRIVPPEWPGLYLLGMINSTTALNRNFEHQSRWVREFLLGNAVLPPADEMVRAIERREAHLRAEYKQTPRHTIEEEHLGYFAALAKSLREAKRRRRRVAA